MDLVGIIRRLPEIVAYNKFDDDLFDRLNYSHTVTILTVFAIIVTNRQFSENQIKCWVPAQFTGSYEQYVNQICFITNTYSFDMHESLPDDYHQRHEHELKYYQWTPFILLLMAILFYIPHQFWRGLSLRSGVDLKDLTEAAQTYRSANLRQDDKIKLLEYLTNWLDSYCSNSYRLTNLQMKKHLSMRKARLFIFRRHSGNYLIISYIFIKILYLLNSIGQIFLLNVLLGRQFWFYGIEIIYRYWTKQIGLLYSGNEYFPKVVLCDFSIREPNHPKEAHRYTVQCVLPFNLFNQQIFTYLYFWLIILSLCNFFSILIWFYRISPRRNFRYLERRLTWHFLTDEQNHTIENKRLFVNQYLQGDGIFMLHLITSNVSDYVCRKIIIELYQVFHRSLDAHMIGREPLFKPISMEKLDDNLEESKHNDDDDDDDGSTDQTIAPDIPPVPNPRQGRISLAHETSTKLSTDQPETVQPIVQHLEVKSTPTHSPSGQKRLRSSLIPLLKDIRQTSEIHMDSSASTTPRYKNVEFSLESDTIVPYNKPTLSVPTHLPPSLPSPSILNLKGPSPYATTYLTTKKRNEHELPYIDDSISSGSTSVRLISTGSVQEPARPKTTLTSTTSFFHRSHDV
ncbi:unnamed protein product [Adineta ricciae]|uniref:Innexin n=2 Tax=Adineta ricciae TaxID=249248 RepID=A0A815BL48_ADIRI|nr:unnamed protein product [Adineta ricciae]